MIFIIPIVIGALALVTGGVGVAKGADGLSKMDEAKGIGENAQKKYEKKKHYKMQSNIEKKLIPK